MTTSDNPGSPSNATTMKGHIVFVPISMRSHLRIMLQLCLNILAIHPNHYATFLITTHISSMYHEEIALQPATMLKKVQARYKLYVIDDQLEKGATVFQEKLAFKAKCEDAFVQLLQPNGPDPIPSLFISDMYRTTIRKQLHDVCQRLDLQAIPVYHLMPSMAIHLHRLLNTTEDHGVYENMLARAKAYQAEGMSDNDAAVKGKLLEWPDLPPMFDSPQTGSTDVSMGTVKVAQLVHTVSRNTDGIVCNSTPEIDGASLARIEEITGVPCLGVGPQFNEELWSAAESTMTPDAVSDTSEEELFSFLDKALRTYGAKSAAYISLGSYFWPTKQPEIISNIIHAALSMEPPMPFVFATASAKAVIPDELREQVRLSGRGMIVSWVPQVKVLKHPAVGAFLTHCGWGSVTEAILTGTPMITLPFSVDQPALSAHFTQVHKIGIQLNQFSSVNDGLVLGDGTTVRFTEQRMQDELRNAFGRIRDDRKDFERRAAAVGDVMRASWLKGRSRESAEKLGQLASAESIS